ncbi:cholinesterase-like [Glandiceps talaboti]
MAFKRVWTFFFTCAVFYEFVHTQALQELTVTLSNGGVIKGKSVEVFDTQVSVFLGIPYGKATGGEMRFRRPVPVDKWDDILEVTDYGNACYGYIDNAYGNFSGSQMWNSKQPLSEDCLNLNVWTPSPRPTNAAVMVWIYGGGYYSGTSGLEVYDAKYLAAEENVIVVSMNYRLGPLGFLFLDHTDTPGNAGLFDQVLALQWVQDNIHHFGGDPDQVTIFGESAGSDSVGYHLLSPMSRNLFKYAIMQSGSPNNPWGSISHELAVNRSTRLAIAVNCSDTNKNAMLSCLRRTDAQRLVDNQFVDSGPYIFPFVPVVDGTFLLETPQSALERHSFKNTSILIGNNLNEGFFFLVYGTAGITAFDNSLTNRDRYHLAIRESFPNFNQFAYDAIAFQYMDWLDPEDREMMRGAIDHVVGDYNIICPSNNFALAYAEVEQTVYKFFFRQVSSNTPWPKWMGCLHGDEIAYVFGIPLDTSTGYSPEEQELSRKMMKYWTSFAKTGHPENEGHWPVFDKTGKHYMNLHTDYLESPKVDRGARANECGFWDNYLPKLNIQTADIEEAEKRWKEEFHQWSTKYMGDWKAEFQNYVTYKGQICNVNEP